MRYFVIGNSHVPRDMTPEQAWISLRIAHNDIQTAFLNYGDAVAVARAHQANKKILCPIIQIDVTSTAEVPISAGFFLNEQYVEDKNRAVYLTMESGDKSTQFNIVDATFDYLDKYTPTSKFTYSKLDFNLIAAERLRLSKEEWREATEIRSKRPDTTQSKIAAELAVKQKGDEQAVKQKADEQAAKQKADEHAAKLKADEQLAKQKADEQAAMQKADGQIEKQMQREEMRIAALEAQANSVEVKAIESLKHSAKLVKFQNSALKSFRRSVAINIHIQQVAAQQSKLKSIIYYGIPALIGAGTLLYFAPSIFATLTGKVAIMATVSVSALYIAKKGWDFGKDFYKEFKLSNQARDASKTADLNLQVERLRYDQGYDLSHSKFGSELQKMLDKSENAKFLANGSPSPLQPSYNRKDVLLWQIKALKQLSTMTTSRKEVKQQLLVEASQKFTP